MELVEATSAWMGRHEAGTLIEEVDADYLVADKGYDSDAIVEKVEESGGCYTSAQKW